MHQAAPPELLSCSLPPWPRAVRGGRSTGWRRRTSCYRCLRASHTGWQIHTSLEQTVCCMYKSLQQTRSYQPCRRSTWRAGRGWWWSTTPPTTACWWAAPCGAPPTPSPCGAGRCHPLHLHLPLLLLHLLILLARPPPPCSPGWAPPALWGGGGCGEAPHLSTLQRTPLLLCSGGAGLLLPHI